MKAFWKKDRSKILFLMVIGGNLIWYGNTAFSVAKPTLTSLGIVTSALIDNQDNNRITYERLGIRTPIKVLPNTNPLENKDWDKLRNALNQGAGLSFLGGDFESSKLAFVTAHSTDSYPHAYSSAFAGLGQAKTGDAFILTLNGQKYEYKVVNTEVLSPYNIEAFTKLTPDDNKLQKAVLVTCWPLFSTKNRLLVIGERNI